jgi:hypothetical protein
MSQYTVVDIGEEDLSTLYPLVWVTSPSVSLDQWIDYARATNERGGILGLLGPDGMPFGFLAYREEATLRHGRVLYIDNFATLELAGVGAGRRALHEAAEDIARERGCASLELRAPSRGYMDDQSSRGRTWAALGYRGDSVVFVKSLAPTSGSRAGEIQARLEPQSIS